MTLKWEGVWDYHDLANCYAHTMTEHGSYCISSDYSVAGNLTPFTLEFTKSYNNWVATHSDDDNVHIVISNEASIQECFDFAEEHAIMQKLTV